MSFLKNISLKNKIVIIIIGITMSTLTLGFSIVIFRNAQNVKKEIVNNTLVNIKLIGEYCIAPLTFEDEQGAESILSKLNNLPYVVSGAIYDRNGILFTTYNRDSADYNAPIYSEDLESNYQFIDNILLVQHNINFKDVHYGHIVINADVNFVSAKVWEQVSLVLIIGVSMLILAFLLARFSQKAVSTPILDLASMTKKIAKEGDYSVHLDRGDSNDEIGVLYDNFNRMLHQINLREKERDKAEKKLKVAKNKAEESDRLKSAFLANMSHEIRTPMNAILGFTDLLTRDEASITKEEKEQYVNLIHTSGNNLLHLINDIIDISKIEADQIKIVYKECHLNKMFEDLLSSYHEIKKQKNREDVEIRTNDTLEKHDIFLKTDPLRLNQILSNLIDNALKFTEHGYVEVGTIIQSDSTILFYVKDTGIGIDEESKKHVFERFRKLEDDKTKLFRGAGLGLAICRSLLDLLGGDIWVDSSLGEGSVFYFTIPYEKINKTANGKNNTVLNTTGFDWPNRKILIAEDEPANLFYITEVLKPTGINILEAKDGQEAIQIFKSNKDVDLIIMDIKMPKLNGFEATKKIKEIKKEVPVISQTAYAMPADKEKGFKHGMDDYITKPINPEKLLKIISKHLK